MKNAENMGFLTISDPVGRSEGPFCPADFKIANEINGLEHISCGMAVISVPLAVVIETFLRTFAGA